MASNYFGPTDKQNSNQHPSLKVDVDTLISNSGCSYEYYALEECLGNTGRDFIQCRPLVTQLKQCNDEILSKKSSK